MTDLSSTGLKRKRSQLKQQTSFLRVDHLTEKSLLERVNWLNCIFVFGLPAMGIYGLLTTSLCWQTAIWMLLFYFWTGWGITAGYHRMYSHRAYKPHPLYEAFIMIGGTGALQGSVKWWSLLHRAHHRYTDTDDDPYNARRGFWYAHIGWMVFDNIEVGREVEMADLKANPLVRFQHKYYAFLGPFMSLVFPCMVSGLLWGDYRGGFYFAGVVRQVFVHHATWCVNSVAHYYGDFTFDDTISPRDSIITGLLTLGEGYHNFHHEFPNDFRNGVHWYDYDPTKWLIRFGEMVGLTYDLIRFDDNTIQRGKLDMRQKRLDEAKAGIDWGVPLAGLPTWDAPTLAAECAKGRALVVAHGVVLDMSRFLAEGMHPGGKRVVLERVGKDVTADICGGVYNHTNAARNLASHMRVALMKEDGDSTGDEGDITDFSE